MGCTRMHALHGLPWLTALACARVPLCIHSEGCCCFWWGWFRILRPAVTVASQSSQPANDYLWWNRLIDGTKVLGREHVLSQTLCWCGGPCMVRSGRPSHRRRSLSRRTDGSSDRNPTRDAGIRGCQRCDAVMDPWFPAVGEIKQCTHSLRHPGVGAETCCSICLPLALPEGVVPKVLLLLGTGQVLVGPDRPGSTRSRSLACIHA